MNRKTQYEMGAATDSLTDSVVATSSMYNLEALMESINSINYRASSAAESLHTINDRILGVEPTIATGDTAKLRDAPSGMIPMIFSLLEVTFSNLAAIEAELARLSRL